MRRNGNRVVQYGIGEHLTWVEAMAQIDSWLRQGRQVLLVSASADRNTQPTPAPLAICLVRSANLAPHEWDFRNAAGQELRSLPLLLDVAQNRQRYLVVSKSALKRLSALTTTAPRRPKQGVS